MSNAGELEHLKELVRSKAPVTTTEVKQIVERYFREDVVWSLLKDEWEKHMTAVQREALCSKLLLDSVGSATATLKTLKLDDIDG